MAFWDVVIFLASWLILAVAVGAFFGRAAAIGDRMADEAMAQENARPHGNVEVL